MTVTENRFNTDPMLVDPAGANFRPRLGSPAIDWGRAVSSVTRDFDGCVRPRGAGYDVGPYEY